MAKLPVPKFNLRLPGGDSETLIVEQYTGRKARLEKYYVEKFEVVSSHCCRRSFATNLYRMGYQLSQIMPMTGHSTESQLRQYIGIDNEQNAESIGLEILRHKDTRSENPNTYLRMVK
jgi:integrase